MAEYVSWATSLSLWIYLAVFAGLILTGFVLTALSLRRQADRHRDIFDFRQRFIEWANGQFRDQSAYMQLIADSPRVQDAMGHWGYYSTFTPPYSRVVYHNWPIILNGLPQIGQNTSDYMGSDRIAGGYVNIIDEALLRALGTLENNIKSRQGGLINPVVLLREGLIYTLTLPFYILAEFGLLTRRAYERIVGSVIVRAIALGVAAFGFFASVVGVTVDWEPFTAKLEQFRQWSGL